MKILIVGAGITGLSTYLFLHRHLTREHQIIIVESYDTRKIRPALRTGEAVNSSTTLTGSPKHTSSTSEDDGSQNHFTPATAGSALGIARNGLACLSRMDNNGRTLSTIMAHGCPITSSVFDCARGWKLAEFEMGGDVGHGSSKEDSGGSANGRKGVASTTNSAVDGHAQDGRAKMKGETDQKEKQLGQMLLITRRALWQERFRSVAWIAGTHDIILNRRLVDIEKTGSGQVLVHFADGACETADLVLGADGMRSTVRACMFRDEKEWGGADYVTPVYE